MRKKHRNPLAKAAKQIEIRGNKHCLCLYSATAMALWQHWGKKKEAISRLFVDSADGDMMRYSPYSVGRITTARNRTNPH